MASTLCLESLPQEILEKIFVSSANPDLPLLSRRLLSKLSSPLLKQRLAVSMLATNDAAIQSKLLGRRFLDLELFDAATREITPACTHDLSDYCPKGFNNNELVDPATHDDMTDNAYDRYFALHPDVPHFVLAQNLDISPRLLCNFQLSATPTNRCPEGRFWKIELLRRLAAGDTTNIWFRTRYLSDLSEAAALKGALEAIRAGNSDALDFLINWDLWRHSEASRSQLFGLAVIEMDCADKGIVRCLCCSDLIGSDGVCNIFNSDSKLVEWIKQRRQEDSRLRSMEVEWADLWTGDWIHGMLYSYYSNPTYQEFVDKKGRQNPAASGKDKLTFDGA